ncbi:MAG: alpha-glucosidase [Pyrinomonadaceae bacterium]|nr:alpha-glucosidase [Pyrinomonadaceae bacterium]
MSKTRILTAFFLSVLLLSACQTAGNNVNRTAPSANEIPDRKWWKEAVIYQIYPRSFKDTNGDGVGDLKGIIEKLDYIKSLGIDAVWINPIYASPNKDNGYDISDYENIMQEFGTMQDFDVMLKGFHDRQIKVFMDLVVNHCSDEHRWFLEAKKSRDNPYYNYFHWWAKEKGEPPKRWSHFDEKADAWQFNEATNSYYLHYFGDFQPDLNWENPKVREEIYKMMRFWLDKGVDGFRMDALAYISKDPNFPPMPESYNGRWSMFYADGPKLHDYIQEMNREVLSKYDVATVAEAAGDVERVMKFVDPTRKELNMAYYFEATDLGYLPNEFKMPDPNGVNLVDLKKIYSKWNKAFEERGWGTTYLANHDQPRITTRWGNDSPEFREISSKMLTTFILTMPGTAFYYFGDELGMTNIKFDKIEDYNDIEVKTNYAQVREKGGDLVRFLEGMKISARDNGRTPMQWNSTANAGFSNGNPWLKVNPNFDKINVETAEKDENSPLNYFRKVIKLRKSDERLVYGKFAVVDDNNPDVFAYTRELNGKKILVLLNFKAKESNSNTGVDLGKTKVLLGNYPEASKDGKLKPFEAVIYQLEE